MHRSKSKSFVSDCGPQTRYGVSQLSIIVALVVLTLGLGGNNRANAAGITINTPAGLTPGDTFRIAFVTDAITMATSTDIAAYNAFVNADATTEAGGGTVTYNGTPLTFSAIGSTSAVDAITNIGESGAPVYLTNGTEVAASDTASAGGLWSGNLLQPLFTDLRGVDGGIPEWTGTDQVGTFAIPLGSPSGHATIGFAADADSQWVDYGLGPTIASTNIFGISQPLSVVPEPASIVLCLSAAGCGAVGAYVRRRRAGRRVR